jgi:hypothetical protein
MKWSNRLRRRIDFLDGDPDWLREAKGHRPRPETGRVVFTAFNQRRFDGPGKVRPEFFFPPFCRKLAENGWRSDFVTRPSELSSSSAGPQVVVNIYREILVDKLRVPKEEPPLTFNSFATGRVIADKERTNRFLTERGIAMPPILEDSQDGAVFSNARQQSGAETWVVSKGEVLDKGRYNTKFVDTRVAHRGKEYYTTIRLLCVGGRILHAYVRARDTAEGSASVHARNTPLDANLIEYLQVEQVNRNRSGLESLARALADILGPGFYSHDVLVERNTGAILLAESGYKFDGYAYAERMRPIMHELPSHAWMDSPAFPELSATAFLEECRELSSGP